MRTKNIISVTLLSIMLILVVFMAVFTACNINKNVDVPEYTEVQPDVDSVEVNTVEERGINIACVDIPRRLYAQYGISPIADSAKTLTAKITPDDAVNKEVDWSVAWKNPSSSWASGKTVTEYVTVSPTSDGALTATATCNQAFGEQILVTVAVRNAQGIKATCTVDYVQKYLGTNLTLYTTVGGSNRQDWATLTIDNLNPTIDWAFQYYSNDDAIMFGQVMQYGSNSHWAVTPVFSDVYTVKETETPTNYDLYVSVAEPYFNAIKDNGATPSVEQAGTLVQMGCARNSQSDKTVGCIFGVSSFGNAFYTNYSKVRNALKSVTSQVMLTWKVTCTLTNSKSYDTVYNVKFNASSLVPLAQNITVDGHISF